MYKYASLTPETLKILRDKDTESPFSGSYNECEIKGTYLCRGCGLPLFRASSQFFSGCGWPSFDEEIKDAVCRKSDVDGQRTEILCARCNGHLGHVFHGERYTPKLTRYCVNSLSVDFINSDQVTDSEEAILAAGCFWGVEYFFKKLPGVLHTEVGYIGGHTVSPNYKKICEKETGHYEAIRIVYNPTVLAYKEVLHYFFEIHDSEQINGQGPDFGQQYRSAIFCYDGLQSQMAQQVIDQLQIQKLQVATRILTMSIFWPGEEYHQDYYGKTGKEPYCHRYTKLFNR